MTNRKECELDSFALLRSQIVRIVVGLRVVRQKVVRIGEDICSRR